MVVAESPKYFFKLFLLQFYLSRLHEKGLVPNCIENSVTSHGLVFDQTRSVEVTTTTVAHYSLPVFEMIARIGEGALLTRPALAGYPLDRGRTPVYCQGQPAGPAERYPLLARQDHRPARAGLHGREPKARTRLPPSGGAPFGSPASSTATSTFPATDTAGTARAARNKIALMVRMVVSPVEGKGAGPCLPSTRRVEVSRIRPRQGHNSLPSNGLWAVVFRERPGKAG